MSKLVFTPDVFNGFMTDRTLLAKIAQEHFDKWLEKQTVVYGEYDGENYCFHNLTKVFTEVKNTHKAYLVCIEEIKPCEHKRIETRYPLGRGGLNYTIEKFYCLDCNKQLKPKNGWEICE